MVRLVLASVLTVLVGWTTVHAAGGETCGSATAIDSLPFSDTGDTTGHDDDHSSLPVVCAQSAYASVAGPDLVYSLSLGTGNDLTILVTPTVATYDTSVYLFEGCGATESCVMAADNGIEGEIEMLHVSGLAPGTYYLYVDSFFDTAPANAGTYGISISGSLGEATSSTTTAPTTTSTTTTLHTADDVCVGGGTIDKAFAKLGKLGGAADETFVLGGTITTSATLDPLGRGAQLLLEDLSGPVTLIDLTAATSPVPPGAPGAGCGPKDGWKKTTYKNTSGALDPPACPAGSAHGLKNLRFKDKRAKGKGLLFRAQGRGASFGTAFGPLRFTIVLAADEASGLAGECATHTFAPGACTLKRAVLRCR